MAITRTEWLHAACRYDCFIAVSGTLYDPHSEDGCNLVDKDSRLESNEATQ